MAPPTNPACIQALALIESAADQGMSTKELEEAFTTEYQAVRKYVANGVARGLLWNLVDKRLAVYFSTAVTQLDGRKTFAQRVKARDAHAVELARERASRYQARIHGGEAAREAARIALAQRREAARKAREDEKQRKAQIRAERLALSKAKRAEAALNNILARKLRGTSRGIVQEADAPPAAIDFSKARITVAPRPPGRYEVLSAPGPFSSTKPGQYVFEATSCAARAAA